MDFYKEEVVISSVDIDNHQECKLSNLFVYFQDLAGKHSDLLSIGRKGVNEKGMQWVVTRFEVDIVRMPKYGEKVTMVTYPGDCNSFFFHRKFYIEDSNHNIIVKASSIWIILDASTHQIVKDPFKGIDMVIVHKEDELNVPKKLDIQEGSLLYSKKIRYSDIDLNGHLNNARYIELIQDAFDLSFYDKNRIKNIVINYNLEFKADDVADIYLTNSNPYCIVGKKGDKVHYVSLITFADR